MKRPAAMPFSSVILGAAALFAQGNESKALEIYVICRFTRY
jgi:hypothetical protein